MNGTYKAKDKRLIAYLAKANELQSTFDEFSLFQVPRLENTQADSLASLGSIIQANGPKSI
ncbi:hypothetical protein Dsin_033122 [Dipteronia sinensis]|uniref:RNase H type-1 domain-containing protein n=1 Tax=Dipteronia sinensis TaxID=43782 RepID=A0AAD9ZCF0_9ROSI|nr:hypothetical protein Dsin_033122 [Dipteronia sinensis]